MGVLLPLATTYINGLAPRRVANRFPIRGSASAGRWTAPWPAWSACS